MVITLDEVGATDDSTITLVGGDNVTLSNVGEADASVLTIDSPDTTYNFSTGLTQEPDPNDTTNPDIVTVTNPFDPDLPLALWSGTCLLYTSDAADE